MNFEYLNSLLSERKYSALVKELYEMNAVDAADFLAIVSDEDLPKVFRMLKKGIAAEIFAELESDTQEKIIHAFSDQEFSKILAPPCYYLTTSTRWEIFAILPIVAALSG